MRYNYKTLNKQTTEKIYKNYTLKKNYIVISLELGPVAKTPNKSYLAPLPRKHTLSKTHSRVSHIQQTNKKKRQIFAFKVKLTQSTNVYTL